MPPDVLLEVSGGVIAGFASAFVPVINAEAVVGAASLTGSLTYLIMASILVAAGQTLGKLVFFEAGRSGRSRLRGRQPRRLDDRGPCRQPNSRLQNRKQQLLQAMRGRSKTNGVVLIAATVGLPPLAIVSVAAGAIPGSRRDFAACCFLGRAIRFTVVGLTVAWAT